MIGFNPFRCLPEWKKITSPAASIKNAMRNTIHLAKPKSSTQSSPLRPRRLYITSSAIISMYLAFSSNMVADCREGCDTTNSDTYLGENAVLGFAYQSTGIGSFALSTGGSTGDTAVGYNAMSAASSTFANVAVGASALQNSSGDANVAIGFSALQNSASGNNNTVVGFDAGVVLIDGSDNTAVGWASLAATTSGSRNTAIGREALGDGSNNTAIGFQVLSSNTANDNTATGYQALLENTTGSGNTANGEFALSNNTSGLNNTACGLSALQGTAGSATGSYNTATGGFALAINSSGSNNTADGIAALGSNTTGGSNTGIGQDALLFNRSGNTNTAVGSEALRNNTTGSNNIALGVNAGMNLTTGSSNIDIGNPGVAGDASTIRIGGGRSTTRVFIWGINGKTVADGVPVLISPSTGQLGTTTSSARYKEKIEAMDKASEAILSLRPVKFRYKKELDSHGIPQFGLVAEEVEKIDPQLVVHDEEGKPYTVRYEAVNAMLLNEFLKEHQQVRELKGQVAELAAGLQKLGAQMETRQTALRVAADHP